MTNEIWKPIKDYENYEVSNHGRVLSKITNKILKVLDNGRGYAMVRLYNNQGKKNFKIHQLVARHFLDNPENHIEVDHINRNRYDNTYLNLRWVNRWTNMQLRHNKITL